MEKIFTVICERGISAGYVILAVIVLRLLFRKSPRWVMGILWALVAIRLSNCGGKSVFCCTKRTTV